MKHKKITYKRPETAKECFDISCLQCYNWYADRGACEKFYREARTAGHYGNTIP